MKPNLKHIGVISPTDLLFTSLKKEILYFDTIAIPNINDSSLISEEIKDCPIRSIDFLLEKGLIIDPIEKYLGKENYLKKIGVESYVETLEQIKKSEKNLTTKIIDSQKNYIPKPINNLADIFSKNLLQGVELVFQNIALKFGIPFSKIINGLHLFTTQQYYDRRKLAIDLQTIHGLNAHPIYIRNSFFDDNFEEGENNCIRLALSSLPEPDFEKASWEQILDFKQDNETKKLLSFFRHWISNFTKQEKTYIELNEELEYQTHKYLEHINHHKLKYKHTLLETVLISTAEFIEGIVRLKPTQSVKAFFYLKHQKLKLNESELSAPCRDIAYIIKANEEFTNKFT